MLFSDSLITKPRFLALLVIASVTGGSGRAHADREVKALAVATAVIVGATLTQPKREEPDFVAFDVGRFDAIRKVRSATAFDFEYRFGSPSLWKLRPFIGGAFTSQLSICGYGGMRLSTYWGERVAVTPSFAVAGYSRGNGKDLGDPAVLGRFGIDVEYRIENDTRIGVSYYHMSNGKVVGQDINPGTEVIGVSLSVPLH